MTIARATAGMLAIAVLVAGAPASAQSVEDVVNGMYDAMARQTEGIDDYTVVQTVMGIETSTYFEKEVVDGRPIFVTRQTAGAGFSMNLGDEEGYGDFTRMAPDLIEHGRYAGRESLEGNDVHVLAIDDLSQLELETPSGSDDMEFMPQRGRVYVDTDEYMPRRMVFEGQARTPDGVHDVTMQVDLLDFRREQGLLLPFRTVMSITGFEAMIDPEMQAEFEEMQKQLEEMDPQQRAMMERMLGPQMEQIQRMMEGDGEPLTFETEISEVRVNAGPPSR